MNPEWTTFTKRIVIRSDTRRVYEAWTTKNQLEKWILRSANYRDPGGKLRGGDEPFKQGDQFEWKWNNWDFTDTGEILRANGSDGITFTFGSGGIVHVDLKSLGEDTEVTLRQEDIPSDEESKLQIFVGCATGWTFWLANLKAWLEYGITLHATGLSQEETRDLVNS